MDKNKRSLVFGVWVFLLLVTFGGALNVRLGSGWSNGGYSADPSNPDYGTHDWIAQHALDWLPAQEKKYILDNLATYLYGTELPDNGGASDGIGDTTKHHIYFNSAEVMTDDAAAVRTSAEYSNALNFLKARDFAKAAKNAGIMSHYIDDVAVFGHVMGSGTDWGSEVHHSDYETYVNERTSSYSAEFNSFLSFDGSLSTISAYDAAVNLAYDTTFDVDGDLTCVWMDQNYDWGNPAFKNRAGESLNLAVNYLADVLHTLYQSSDTTPPTTTDDFEETWHTADFTITLSVSDIDSGLAETYYKINNGPTKAVSADGQPLITTEDSNNKLEYWSLDNAGNEESHHILTGIKLDKTAPTGSLTIAGGSAYTNSLLVTLTLSANDATSGVAKMRFSHDNVAWTSWEVYSTSKAWTLTTGEGTKIAHVQFMDNVAFTSQTYQDTITLDATKPVANAGQNQTVNGVTATFDASASSDNLDIVSYEWNFGDEITGTGKITTHTCANTGTYIVTLVVKDAAGNTATHSVKLTVLSAEVFPMWMIGAAIATIAIIVATTLFLRKRKRINKNT